VSVFVGVDAGSRTTDAVVVDLHNLTPPRVLAAAEVRADAQAGRPLTCPRGDRWG
jgi:activator of 2-hydroxyglutaryl-CoA dehydratase